MFVKDWGTIKMKKLIVVFTVLCLQGCAAIALSTIWPKSHDPEMFGRLIDVKIAVNKLECGVPDGWSNTDQLIEKLKVYAALRSDPQADAIGKLQEAMKKAGESKNKLFCESILKANKVRIDIIVDAWKGR